MINAFPTPILKLDNFVNDELFKETLLSYILEEEKNKSSSEAYSLKGKNGWHSPDNLCDDNQPWSTDLTKYIVDSINYFVFDVGGKPITSERLKIKCWAMVIRDHDYSTVHTHPNSDISGCFYLKVPKNLKETEGNIVFVDPRGGARGSKLFGSGAIVVKPVENTMLVFPSWLDHYVQSHETGDTRVSVAWNVTVLE
jgi:uncharacterized protein (TIGR02466 family)